MAHWHFLSLARQLIFALFTNRLHGTFKHFTTISLSEKKKEGLCFVYMFRIITQLFTRAAPLKKNVVLWNWIDAFCYLCTFIGRKQWVKLFTTSHLLPSERSSCFLALSLCYLPLLKRLVLFTAVEGTCAFYWCCTSRGLSVATTWRQSRPVFKAVRLNRVQTRVELWPPRRWRRPRRVRDYLSRNGSKWSKRAKWANRCANWLLSFIAAKHRSLTRWRRRSATCTSGTCSAAATTRRWAPASDSVTLGTNRLTIRCTSGTTNRNRSAFASRGPCCSARPATRPLSSELPTLPLQTAGSRISEDSITL